MIHFNNASLESSRQGRQFYWTYRCFASEERESVLWNAHYSCGNRTLFVNIIFALSKSHVSCENHKWFQKMFVKQGETDTHRLWNSEVDTPFSELTHRVSESGTNVCEITYGLWKKKWHIVSKTHSPFLKQTHFVFGIYTTLLKLTQCSWNL